MPRPAVISDRDWTKMTARLALPDAARPHIEREIVWYQELDSVWKCPPNQVNKRLKRVADAASKLADLLEGLGDREQIELIKAWPHEISLRPQLSKIDAAALSARTVALVCNAAEISKLSQPERVDGLIERLDAILHDFLKVRVSASQAVMTFLVEVFEAAGIELKERSIRAAVEQFHARGKNQKKDSSNSATDSSRQ